MQRLKQFNYFIKGGIIKNEAYFYYIFFGGRGGGKAKGKDLNGQTVRKGIVLDFLTMK